MCSTLPSCVHTHKNKTKVNGWTMGHTSLSHQVLCLLELWLPTFACYLLLVPKRVLPLQLASSLVIGQTTSGPQSVGQFLTRNSSQLFPPIPPRGPHWIMGLKAQREWTPSFMNHQDRGKRSYSPIACGNIPLWIPIQTCINPESARCSTPCLS